MAKETAPGMGAAGKCCCYYCAAMMIFGILVFFILIFLESVGHKWLIYKQESADTGPKITGLLMISGIYLLLFLLCAGCICCDNSKKRRYMARLEEENIEDIPE